MNRPTKEITITLENIQALTYDLAITRITWRAGPIITATLALFPNTLVLDISNNGLTTIDSLCTQDGEPVLRWLIDLDCSNNRLKSLCGIQHSYWLARLNCDHNYLQSLAYLEGCHRLMILSCRANYIKDYGSLLALPQLYHFAHDIDLRIISQQSRSVKAIMHNFVVDGVSMPMVHRPNYYMWDTEFMKSADMAVVNLLADPKPRNSFAETDTLCIHPDVLTTLYQLCADVAVHPVFLITFAELLDYVWHRINSSPNRTELIKTFNDFMARARNLDVEHLFRYTIYSIAKPFDDLVIIYSEASNLDRFIRDIECEDATDSMSMICYKVFQAAAVLNQTYDTALALVCSLAEHIYSYSNPLLDSRAEHMLILYSYTELTYNSLKRTYNSLKRTNY